MNRDWMRISIRAGAIGLCVLMLYLFLYSSLLLEDFTPHKKSISILAWPTSINADHLQEFEEKTGIKVYLSYFENNEELFVKLRAGESSGYDLVMPSDYAVDLLAEKKLIQPIDTTRLSFYDQLYPELLRGQQDTQHQYYLPFSWGVYGIAVDRRYFDQAARPLVDSWGLVFDKRIAPKRVGMIEDAGEIVAIAAQYLFGSIKDLNERQLNQIQDLLVRQKEWVTMYTDMRADYLLVSQTSSAVVTISTEVGRVMRDHSYIDFIVPQEGTFIAIDTFAIPSGTQNLAMIYEFLEYIYTPEIMKKYQDRYNFLAASKAVPSHNSPFSFANPTPELFSKLHFFKTGLSDEILTRIWIALKGK